jgi:cytochrome c oxidase cbb3-type subunit 2
MNEQKKQENPPLKYNSISDFLHHLDRSAILTIIGVVLLFSTSILVVLILPSYVDSTWTSPSSPYQAQMYEVEDPNIYISSASTGGNDLQYVRHLKQGFSLIAFKESDNLRLIAPLKLEKYITKVDEKELKLTSRLLLLREPEGGALAQANVYRTELQNSQKEKKQEENSIGKVNYQILELYDPNVKELFSYEPGGGILQNWVDKDFKIMDEDTLLPYDSDYGVIYAQNPQEFRISPVRFGSTERWRYDPEGTSVKTLEELKKPEMGFHSRQELIHFGEHIYAIEGCWYCHTDQTRTLIQDTVLNGSDSFPAPPSSANEYIYQKITFAGTRRIGPDISRVGVKRPSRDWHKAHFWAPKTASAGSIMPAFQHFFDNDPRGTGKSSAGIPNFQFEAVYQYMMTKGTRITPPTQAWWLGKDPIKTKEIIEGQRALP